MTRVRKGRNTAGGKHKERKKADIAKSRRDNSQEGWIIHTVKQRAPGLGGGVMAGLEDLNNDGDIVSVAVHIV